MMPAPQLERYVREALSGAGFHSDAIRIPMMLLAVGGSIVNLYVIWRIRSLRARASSRRRAQPVSAGKLRSERIQIALAVATLI